MGLEVGGGGMEEEEEEKEEEKIPPCERKFPVLRP